MAKNWMSKLADLEGAVSQPKDIHSQVIQTASPSLNFTFGHGWGMPRGHSILLYGLPKAGKSIVSLMFAAGAQKDYKDGIVIKFNTEMREEGQVDNHLSEILGLDRNRYMGFDVNSPALIFDKIEKEISALCQDGMPLITVILDSVNGVKGRRAMDSDTIMDQQRGDVAATLKDGLKRILPIQRKHNFALIMTSHVSVEMDPTLAKVHGPWKLGASNGTQGHTEYFLLVERNIWKAGRQDAMGNDLVDENLKDLAGKDGKGELTGNKIQVTMKDSSFGVRGRTGEFTFDFNRGVINQHEEVFLLSTRRGVVQRPNNTSYVFGERKWVGKEAFLEALKNDQGLQDAILKELRMRDLAGQMAVYDAADAKVADASGKTPS